MNIIERAVDRLAQGSQEPSSRAVNGNAAREGLIEKTAGKSIPLSSDLPGEADAAKSTDSNRPAAAATALDSRTLKIDLENLRLHRVITPDSGRTQISENFRRIKRHILALVAKPEAARGVNLIMVTSALPGEGKTFCAVNLAMSIAMEVDCTVLLVDGDVAKPSVMPLLGVNASRDKGLMDVLLDHNIVLSDVILRTDIGKLSVLPAGRQHPRATEMLASESMKALLQEMAERYRDRIIIFDAPPLLVTSEASVLTSLVGQIVMVVEAGKTSEKALKSALSRIASHASIGMLLNKGMEPGHSEYGYGYGYGYGHGSGDG